MQVNSQLMEVWATSRNARWREPARPSSPKQPLCVGPGSCSSKGYTAVAEEIEICKVHWPSLPTPPLSIDAVQDTEMKSIGFDRTLDYGLARIGGSSVRERRLRRGQEEAEPTLRNIRYGPDLGP